MVIKKALSGRVLGVLIILLAVFGYTPLLKHPIFLLASGALCAVIIVRHSKEKAIRRNQRLVACVILYLSVCIIYKLFGISSLGIGQLLKHLFFFIPILLMLIMDDCISVQQKKWVLGGIIVVVLFNIGDNIRLCIQNPEIMLLVNRDMASEDVLGGASNIGGSSWYNAVVFFFVMTFFLFLNSSEYKKTYLFISIVTAVFIFIFCLKASIMVFAVLSAFLLYFARKTKSFLKFVINLMVPVVLLYSISIFFSDLIIEMISNLFSSERLVERLVFLVDSENAGGSAGSGTVEARENLWMLSFNTWLDSPINFLFGIGDHKVDWEAGQTADDSGIGQHSDIFDNLARYGLIGLFLTLSIFYMAYKYIVSLFDKTYRIQISVIFMILILFGITKGIFTTAIGSMMFLMLPLASKFVNREIE